MYFLSERNTIDQYPMESADALSPFNDYYISLPHIDEPFLTLTLKLKDGASRHSINDIWISKNATEQWENVEFDPHLGEGNHQISTLIFLYPGQTSIRLRIPTQTIDPGDLELHWFHPGSSLRLLDSESDLMSADYSKRGDCNCEYPSVWERNDWCPLGLCPEQVGGIPSDAGHFIVHHSAGINQSSDWPAVVRSIWNQHVNINGWADIGYHYLIDSEGTIYRGRQPNIQGAHFCATNANTLGVCLMGNFNVAFPNPKATSSAVELLGWHLCVKDLNPLESSFHASSGLFLNNIAGHRDGCGTDCPGHAWYPQLYDFRTSVENYISFVCNPELLPTPEIEHAWIESEGLFIVYNYPSDTGNLLGLVAEYKIEEENPFEILDSIYSFSQPLSFEYPFQEGAYIRIKVFGENAESEWSPPYEANIETTGLQDIRQYQFLVYPNPASSVIFFRKTNVENAKPLQIEINGADGQLIHIEHWLLGSDTYEWNCRDIPPGIYFYSIRSEKGVLGSGKIKLAR